MNIEDYLETDMNERIEPQNEFDRLDIATCNTSTSLRLVWWLIRHA